MSTSAVQALSRAAQLREELRLCNAVYATRRSIKPTESLGPRPTLIYEPFGDQHGNFLDASYRAILRRPEWAKRLGKVHSSGRTHLPKAERRWCELDSSTSSDALLMNVFCYPGTLRRAAVTRLLGVEAGAEPVFGFRAGVAFANGHLDRTEVDMRLGRTLFEAKLTESDFQTAPLGLVEAYRDFHAVFDQPALPKVGARYASYQLIRNVLAAHVHACAFCVLHDERREDLREMWFSVMRAVKLHELRLRCQVLTWQELAAVLPPILQGFLAEKYGCRAQKGTPMR
jgi:hypothetical protein